MNEQKEGNLTTADLAYGKDRDRQNGPEAETSERSETSRETEAQPLFVEGDAQGYQDRWQQIQIRFVDEPKDSVHDADTLVAEIVQKLTTRFAEEKENLERQWSSGEQVSTEDLRQALQHYRSFFQRLLAA